MGLLPWVKRLSPREPYHRPYITSSNQWTASDPRQKIVVNEIVTSTSGVTTSHSCKELFNELCAHIEQYRYTDITPELVIHN